MPCRSTLEKIPTLSVKITRRSGLPDWTLPPPFPSQIHPNNQKTSHPTTAGADKGISDPDVESAFCPKPGGSGLAEAALADEAMEEVEVEGVVDAELVEVAEATETVEVMDDARLKSHPVCISWATQFCGDILPIHSRTFLCSYRGLYSTLLYCSSKFSTKGVNQTCRKIRSIGSPLPLAPTPSLAANFSTHKPAHPSQTGYFVSPSNCTMPQNQTREAKVSQNDKMCHHWHDGQPDIIIIIIPHHLKRIGVAAVHECSGSAATGVRLLEDHGQTVERLGLSLRVEPSDVIHHYF
jgi:hypothetical protein